MMESSLGYLYFCLVFAVMFLFAACLVCRQRRQTITVNTSSSHDAIPANASVIIWSTSNVVTRDIDNSSSKANENIAVAIPTYPVA